MLEQTPRPEAQRFFALAALDQTGEGIGPEGMHLVAVVIELLDEWQPAERHLRRPRTGASDGSDQDVVDGTERRQQPEEAGTFGVQRGDHLVAQVLGGRIAAECVRQHGQGRPTQDVIVAGNHRRGGEAELTDLGVVELER